MANQLGHRAAELPTELHIGRGVRLVRDSRCRAAEGVYAVGSGAVAPPTARRSNAVGEPHHPRHAASVCPALAIHVQE
ncbi:hypothetical protein OG705_33855 [Streptomyces sp. NBC_00838]|uniref:hypothetical protein n=1 Tax=Streptomyces sp. NBC_00838 TaxID=2903680 RepID=UPI00386B166A|nr:hypothetical protein OG705_33855 [Streptomyces sp. NBC_00838]